MASVERSNQQKRRRQVASTHATTNASSSTTSNRFPSIFPGQSLAHNLHEVVLGVLINSNNNGQNVLSRQSLSVKKKNYRYVANKHSTSKPRSAALKSSSSSPATATIPSSYSSRTVQRIDRFERIPTWPTQNGLRFNAVSKINPDLAAKLEHDHGGADCPNIWLNNHSNNNAARETTSPFLMMCHHNHSFQLNDPIRILQKNIIPEGFPSHGHRGMTTVTIVLRGGLVHRDSLGNKQIFGAVDDNTNNNKKNRNNPYNNKHTQWCTFGRGMIHELMFDNDNSRPRRRSSNNSRKVQDEEIIHQELYQIWIDLPQSKRYMEPRVELLGDTDDDDFTTPTVIDSSSKNVQTTIIAGEYNGVKASVDTITNLAI